MDLGHAHSPQPMARSRGQLCRRRSAILATVAGVLLVLHLWRGADTSVVSQHDFTLNAANGRLEPDESVLLLNSSSFHVLLPATESNVNLCKTLLSAFVLGYPAPILINWNQDISQDQGVFDKSQGHTAKIRGVLDFLNDKTQVKDEDIVLIADGYDVWFQIPPRILLRRYHRLVREGNERLRKRYGMHKIRSIDMEKSRHRVQKYSQSVVWGADKICWPNSREDLACTAIPFSTLPKDIYGPKTDQDPEAYLNRPRYLNSGGVIGPAKDIRAIYQLASHLVEDEDKGFLGDQFVFGQIFGEQEYRREILRTSHRGTSDWDSWMKQISRNSDDAKSPLAVNVKINGITLDPNHRYEYSIGLDYESQIFQTMTHSEADVEFVLYKNLSSSSSESTDQASPQSKSRPLFLSMDLQSAESPLSFSSPGNRTADLDATRIQSYLLPFSDNLDNLPENEDVSWHDINLAVNIGTASVPAMLHINGDKSLLDTWWPRMWYHPFARALVRRFIRSAQTPEAIYAASTGGRGWLNDRGGRGGVWTDQQTWMSWSEVCPGVEEAVFGDGKGIWGKEEGDGKVHGPFGKLLVGEE